VCHALAESPYLHSYPDPESRELRQKLSHYVNVDAAYLMVGHGADELIDLVMRLFLNTGDKIINCPPTFGMYSFDASINGGQTINIPRRPDFSLDVAAIEAAASGPDVKLLFVTSPNNPDGSLISEADLKKFLNLPIVVILDEAYAEFTNTRFADWVPDYPNLIVLRTFSKWAGLADLRVGYGIFPLSIMTHLWKIKQPYNVNLAGQLAAIASLEDVDYLLANVAKIVAARDVLYQGLIQFDWLKPYPSQANFILCRVLQRDAAEIKAALARKGILVRYYNSSGLKDHLRFSVGTPEQIEILLNALSLL
jgi:histidinol-phosphate aminotransferase